MQNLEKGNIVKLNSSLKKKMLCTHLDFKKEYKVKQKWNGVYKGKLVYFLEGLDEPFYTEDLILIRKT